MLRLSRFWDNFFCNHHFTHIASSVCPSARQPLSNPRPNKFSIHQSLKVWQQLFFWLRVWLFGGLAETNFNQFEQKSPKITLHRNWKCSFPKTGSHVIKVSYDRWKAYPSFVERSFFYLKSDWSTGKPWSWGKIPVFRLQLIFFCLLEKNT